MVLTNPEQKLSPSDKDRLQTVPTAQPHARRIAGARETERQFTS